MIWWKFCGMGRFREDSLKKTSNPYKVKLSWWMRRCIHFSPRSDKAWVFCLCSLKLSATGNIPGQKPYCEETENLDLIRKAEAGICYNQISLPKKSSDDKVKNDLKSLLYSYRPKNTGACGSGEKEYFSGNSTTQEQNHSLVLLCMYKTKRKVRKMLLESYINTKNNLPSCKIYKDIKTGLNNAQQKDEQL